MPFVKFLSKMRLQNILGSRALAAWEEHARMQEFLQKILDKAKPVVS